VCGDYSILFWCMKHSSIIGEKEEIVLLSDIDWLTIETTIQYWNTSYWRRPLLLCNYWQYWLLVMYYDININTISMCQIDTNIKYSVNDVEYYWWYSEGREGYYNDLKIDYSAKMAKAMTIESSRRSIVWLFRYLKEVTIIKLMIEATIDCYDDTYWYWLWKWKWPIF